MKEQIKLVYVVTAYGKVIGVFADQNEAFDLQMRSALLGHMVELVPMNVIYPQDFKNHE